MMRKSVRNWVLNSFLALLTLTQSVREIAAVDIIDLGNLGGTRLIPTALSRDGNTVVGTVIGDAGSQRGFIWSKVSGISYLTETGSKGAAWGITSDGSQVVGFQTVPGSTTHSNAFRWTAQNGFEFLSPVSSSSHGFSVSNDGQTVVGRVQASYDGNPNSSSPQAAIWDSGSTQAFIPLLSPFCSFTSVSGDGSIIAGYGAFPDSPYSSNTAFVWDRMNGIKSLDVPTGFSGSVATQISEDGQWIVGIVNSSLGDQPALWDKDGNATLMQNHGIWSRALSLADAEELGMIKTGVSWENSDSQEKTAVIWDDLNQSSDLLRILRYQNATGIDQWESLNEATAVRYDPLTGLNIIGYGTINGESRGFLIQDLTTTVPETRSWVMGLIGIAFAVLMKYKKQI